MYRREDGRGRSAGVGALVLLVLLALLAGCVWPAEAAETFRGRVVGITDGDTLKVLRDGHVAIVRLQGIDAPETGQAYGTRAKQYAGALAFGTIVTVHATGRDRHGRVLAEVVLPDGRSLNRELVRAGYAWWFRKYSADPTLARLEADARDARRGLWADGHPVPPWEHRQQRGQRLGPITLRGVSNHLA